MMGCDYNTTVNSGHRALIALWLFHSGWLYNGFYLSINQPDRLYTVMMTSLLRQSDEATLTWCKWRWENMARDRLSWKPFHMNQQLYRSTLILKKYTFVRPVLYFVAVGYGGFYPCPSRLHHWHWGNGMIVPVPLGSPWRLWVDKPPSQWIRDAIITSFLRQNDVATSFWRNKDVIISAYVRLG